MPTISVIMVCKDRERTISKALESVLVQTSPPLEYIIIDGASTDTTVEIIESYIPRLKARGIACTFISEPDKGMYYALNKAIPLAMGEWLHFLNSDDWYFEETTLQRAKAILQESMSDIVYGETVLYCAKTRMETGRGNVKPAERLRQELRVDCCIQQPAAFYRKIVFSNRLFDTSFRINADYEHFLYLADSGASFEYHPIPFTGFLYGDGLSTQGADSQLMDYIRIQLRYGIFDRRLYQRLRKLLILKKRLFAHGARLFLERIFTRKSA